MSWVDDVLDGIADTGGDVWDWITSDGGADGIAGSGIQLTDLLALLGGVGAATDWFGLDDDKGPVVGYQGEIPRYSAVREQVPMDHTLDRMPGAYGQRYFSDTFYAKPGEEEARQADAQNQAALLAQANAAQFQDIMPLLERIQGIYNDSRPAAGTTGPGATLPPTPGPNPAPTQPGRPTQPAPAPSPDPVAAPNPVPTQPTRPAPAPTPRPTVPVTPMPSDGLVLGGGTQPAPVSYVNGAGRPSEWDDVHDGDWNMGDNWYTAGRSGPASAKAVQSNPGALESYWQSNPDALAAAIKANPGAFGFAGGGGVPALMPKGMLGGPQDGMADGIPALLSGGEFVIPADVVSHVGNGNTQAGEKELYAMMDRIRQARTGTKEQGAPINPKSVLPA